MADVVIVVLLGIAGVLFCIAITAMAVARSPLDRLHFLSLITTGVVPAAVVAAAVQEGPSLGAAMVLAIGLVVVLSGPVLSMAVGRVIEEELHADTGESPE
ncbi:MULTISPECIES: monovalent cation/H(+) antiporter subunit G [unclassified Arthrobacter]|uniref:monovalent cation/H(+) antiporter subunit G n=1 Tax=unclassified Arthrobacter TaxID=235627 RepID=UPI00159E4F00|nr:MULTISPECIES: monovalent cation/H(+) antiporter subunit G [unclassified Arthrobacter]MCQ9165756.1 monovalent cation/H(+) antiporter subunit G [Arthrobacter sp. STN4]NVM99096.1 monovalent cation/H(+) antiporter subunit G [Arthrobacter sp. SDTb3-6]